MYEKRNGSDRLSWALYCLKNNRTAAGQLASLLNYREAQLLEDIQALHDRLEEINEKEREEESQN